MLCLFRLAQMYANMIQNVVRGFLVRRTTRKLLAQRRAERMRKVAAATAIQAAVRMFLAKRRLMTLQEEERLRDIRRLERKRRKLQQVAIRTRVSWMALQPAPQLSNWLLCLLARRGVLGAAGWPHDPEPERSGAPGEGVHL